MGVNTYLKVTSIKNSYNHMLETDVKVLTESEQVLTSFAQQVASFRNYLLTKDPVAIETLEKYNLETKQLLNDIEKELNSKGKNNINELIKMNEEFSQQSNEIIVLSKTKTFDEIRPQVKSLTELYREIRDKGQAVVKNQKDEMEQLKVKNDIKITSALKQLAVLTVCIMIIMIVMTLILARKITKPIDKMVEYSRQVASGNLSVEQIHTKSHDEVGILANSFTEMVNELKNTIKQVNESAEKVAGFSESLAEKAVRISNTTHHIAEDIQQVSKGAEEQVAAADESVEVINEMTVGVHRVAQTASEIADASQDMTNYANDGRKNVEKAISQMNSIQAGTQETAQVISKLKSDSEQIGSILSIITDISEQTNLLALNAAIEAARAGEAGKGFAVVSEEIRKLADQTSRSANDIQALINIIQQNTDQAVITMKRDEENVASGMKLIQDVGEMFGTIQLQIETIGERIEDMSAVSEEMASGSSQITSSVESIAQIAKKSAEKANTVAEGSTGQMLTIDEISNAIKDLSNMADELKKLVHKFQV